VSPAVGVLGGAFNPPHIGHLLLAQEAATSLGLDEVVLVPTGSAPHKRIEQEPGAELRLEMTIAAVAGVDGFRVSDVEVARAGPSFAYRTLELLADELPGSELTFVMGADVASGLARWKRPERVVELARVAVAGRPGFELDTIDEVLAGLGAAIPAERIEMPPVGISSTLIRERVATGRPIRWMVPGSVERLIADRRLYGEEA
jgi:nicotinate-nucleotide adenylyltransferase